MTPSTVIVTDALWRKSVSAIRSLGRAGYRVIALGESQLTTGFHSRYTSDAFVGPTAGTSPDGFRAVIETALQKATTDGRPIILPMEDETCWWLLRQGATLQSRADWLLPSIQAFATASDKAETMRLAEQIGIPCPRTLFPASPEDLLRLLRSEPAIHWVAKPRSGRGSAGILYDAEITPEAVAAAWATHGPLLIQERIPAEGRASGVSLLYDRSGTCQAVFCHQRLRQYPVTGGPSTSRISVNPDEMATQVAYSRRLLEHLQWRGVAMVEWKQDPTTGRHLLLEINPRFWGSLDLAIRAGVDFPALYARAAAGREPPDAPSPYRAGVVCRWMIPGEILRYWAEPRGQRESLREFLIGSVRNAEEFARDDLRGSIACVACPAVLALNPRYWRYLRRGPKRAAP